MALFDRTTARTKLDVPRQWLDSRAMKRPLPSVSSFREPSGCLVCAEAFLALFGARGLRVLWSLALGIWSFFPSSHALAAAPENWSTNASASLSNGSFETGTSSPEGWQLHPGGSWVTDMAHGGAHSLRGDAKRQARIGESESVVVEPGADYRVDGWISCSSGVARLGVDFLDERDRVISHGSAPEVRAAAGWRYVALEANAAKATRARVWFRVNGRAELDDVALVPAANSFMGNKGLEPDDRGRIGFWGEEKDDTLLPGRRAGEFRPDSDVKHGGKSSVRLSPSADWFAFSSINYGLAPWTDRYEFSAWARCEGPATARILACWTDAQQKVVHVDAGDPIKGEDWRRISLSLTAPTNAASVRLVVAASGGRVWFDDGNLLRLRPRQWRVRVFVNQVGYDENGPKSAVVASNLFPPERSELEFELLTPAGKKVRSQKVPCSGRIYGGAEDDWGWYFWRTDFSSWRAVGQFRARAQLEKVQGESVPFLIESGAVLKETAQSAVDFFFIQRCGFEVPGWHKVCHLDDAKLPDGQHIDAMGGWHSAGDYNKLMYEHGDGGVAFALLKALSAAPECFDRYDRNGDGLPDALDEALWGAQFVAKMQVPETGALRNHVSQGPGRQWSKWSAPEVHTDNVVGTADDPVIQEGEGNSPLVIGAWARLSALREKGGRTNNYLAAALRLWNHATNGGTNAGSPYLLLSALDLHAVTGDQAYLDYARRSVNALLAQQTTTGRLQGAFGNYGEGVAASLASFALAYKNDPLIPGIAQALNGYIAFCARQADNPFGLSQQTVGQATQFFPSDLGHNFQILQRAWAAALAYRVTREPKALVFATDQMDWVLGKNPLDLCMFEGKGAFNPPRYHHRYNQIPGHERGAVPGTVPNGCVRDLGMADRPGFDLSRGGNRSPSHRTSEPWLVHNLFYLLAASQLHRAAREAGP